MHRLAPQAVADLAQIASGIVERGGDAGSAERLISTIAERFFVLAAHPFLGRPRADLGEGRRSHVVGNYVVIYRVDDGDVSILRVVHGRRDIDRLPDL